MSLFVFIASCLTPSFRWVKKKTRCNPRQLPICQIPLINGNRGIIAITRMFFWDQAHNKKRILWPGFDVFFCCEATMYFRFICLELNFNLWFLKSLSVAVKWLFRCGHSSPASARSASWLWDKSPTWSFGLGMVPSS